MTQKFCHRTGCPNTKRHGRSYLYCSDECSRIVALAQKRLDSKTWRAEHSERIWIANLWKRFKLTPESYQNLIDGQGGRCAICKTSEPGGRYKTWHVDHDHGCCPGRYTCGDCIRGVLCMRCNGWLLPALEHENYFAALAYLGRTSHG